MRFLRIRRSQLFGRKRAKMQEDLLRHVGCGWGRKGEGLCGAILVVISVREEEMSE
jgi:hypothetical protein